MTLQNELNRISTSTEITHVPQSEQRPIPTPFIQQPQHDRRDTRRQRPQSKPIDQNPTERPVPNALPLRIASTKSFIYFAQ